MKHTLRILLVLLLVLSLSSVAWAFPDTSNLNQQQQAALDYLVDRGVVEGFPDNTFRPFNTVTRAEFAKMICVYAGYGELAASSGRFSDVLSGAWHFGWVERAAGQGLVTGYADGTFRPGNTITQQEIATILLRLQGLDEEGMVWPADFIAEAQERGLTEGFSFSGPTAATRIVAVQMIYNLTESSTPGQNQTEDQSLAGIIVELDRDQGSITIIDIEEERTTLSFNRNQVPQNLFLGAYVEVSYRNNALLSIDESIVPRRGIAHWNISADGRSVIIDGQSYDISNADIFAVRYTLNRPFGDDSFLSAGPINRAILGMGDVLAAEMAVVIDAGSNSISRAYVVNASVRLTSGRLDVVDSRFIIAGTTYLEFVGRTGRLPLADNVTGTPQADNLIFYTLRNGEIDNITTVVDFNAGLGGTVNSLVGLLTGTDLADPYAWVLNNGGSAQVPSGGTIATAQVTIISHDRGSIVLGNAGSNQRYTMASGALIYEVNADFEISRASSNIIRPDYQALAIVNRGGQVLQLFVFTD